MCKAVEDLCKEAAALSKEETERAKNKAIVFKMFKAGEPDEKIMDYFEISQAELAELRAEYNDV